MATSRLRKTFHYPADSDSDNEPEDLDEEEQEKLITSLRTQDESKNAFYKKALLPLALAPILLYAPALLTGRTASSRLLALLAISSLLSTAYILHFIPPAKPDRKGKRPVYLAQAEDGGPVRKYLISLNAGLCGVLVFVALAAWKKDRPEEIWRGLVPGVTYAIVTYARSQMVSIDVGQLERLRYEYKGA
ncbi:hypothetical protein LTR66_002143 [Elasticomyces elasticus]|nr:hypothetical protein LTR66_002143 [Elasticomyces elasticus]